MTIDSPDPRRDGPTSDAGFSARSLPAGVGGRTVAPPAERLEQIEFAAWRDLLTSSDQAIRAAAAIQVDRVGDLTVASTSAHDILAFNRVLHRDPGTAIDGEALDRLIAHFRARGVRRAFLPWPPPAPGVRAGWELDRRGIRRHNRWVKLWRGPAPAPPVRSALSVEPLGARDRGVLEEVLAAGFDWPAPILRLWSALVDRRRWTVLAARSGRRVVGIGGLFVRGRAAWFGPAATLPGFRGQGAQSALLHQRIEAARAAGCHLMAVETADPTPHREVASLRNVQRLGFEIAYRRENYLIPLAE